MEKENASVIVEQWINKPADRVWKAITQKDEMKVWFFSQMVEFKPVTGFETAFDVSFDGKTYRHLWKVTEVSPTHLTTLNWKYAGYSGDSFVTYELIQQDGKTKVRLIHSFVKSFPVDDPVFSRKSTIEGWKYFIRKSLKKYLDENPVS